MTTVSTRQVAALLEHPERVSLKRMAWAYGCSRAGSDEEAALRSELIEVVTPLVLDALLQARPDLAELVRQMRTVKHTPRVHQMPQDRAGSFGPVQTGQISTGHSGATGEKSE